MPRFYAESDGDVWAKTYYVVDSEMVVDRIDFTSMYYARRAAEMLNRASNPAQVVFPKKWLR